MIRLALFFAMFLLLSYKSSAEESSFGSQAMPRIKMAYTADQLLKLGNDVNDPLYILAAAALYRDSVVSNQTVEGRQVLQSMVERAIEMAPGNSLISGMANDIVNPKRKIVMRGIISKVKEKHGVLVPGEKIAFEAEFEGGEDASAALVLDPKVVSKLNIRTDFGVDFFVRDANSRDICSVQSTSVPYNCSWTPSTQSKFRIELRNSGRVNAPYALYFE